MPTIFDDDLDERTVSQEPEAKRKNVWEMPCIVARKKAMEPRLEHKRTVTDAHTAYSMGEWRDRFYQIKEAIAASWKLDDRGREIPEGFEEERESRQTKKLKRELAEHMEDAAQRERKKDEVGKLGNDSILLDYQRQDVERQLGPKAKIVAAPLPEVEPDMDAYEEAVPTIKPLGKEIAVATRKAGYRSLDEMIAAIPAQREIAAARFRKNLRLGGFCLVKPKRAGRNIPPMLMAGEFVSGNGNIAISVDPLGLLAEVFPDKFDEIVKRKTVEFCETHGVDETSDARGELDELRERLRQAEITEEQQIRAHDKIGVFLPRRQDANLQIVFDYRRK